MAKYVRPTFDRFQGFPKDALAFLAELEKNNNREWFLANKPRYEAVLKAPLEAFVADGERAYGSGKKFRIYQDQRFHKDRPPYKTHGSAVFERRGIVHYLHVEKDHLFAACGCYQMARDQLKRFWAAIDDARSGKKLEKLLADAAKAKLEIGGSALKTAPRGYAKDHPRVELLRHKGLTVSRRFETRPWFHSKQCGEKVVDVFEAAAPINAWLEKHVGESEEGRRYVKRT
ncbi:MAG: DUF2461 domain-containing protein [Myxococcota bacterium]